MLVYKVIKKEVFSVTKHHNLTSVPSTNISELPSQNYVFSQYTPNHNQQMRIFFFFFKGSLKVCARGC